MRNRFRVARFVMWKVKVQNQAFATLNISSDQLSDTVYRNSCTTTGFQPQALPDNFTHSFADNHYSCDQEQSHYLFGSQMDHSFPETNKMMNAPNEEINRHLNFKPQHFSEQQFPQRPHNSEWTNHQVMMNAFSLPKIGLDHFSGDTLMWHQGYSFFKSTIHDNLALSAVQKMTYLQNSVTEQWPQTRMDDPSSFVSFASFMRRLVQTFRIHHFESDLKASAVVIVATEKLITPMTIRWNQEVRSMKIEQPSLADFSDWISTYAEACEDVSRQRPQRTDRVEQHSQGQKHLNIIHQASSNSQLCSGDHKLVAAKKTWASL